MRKRPLLEWLSKRRTDRGIGFATTDGGWRYHAYDDLAAMSGMVASRLRRIGVGRHDVVALIQGSTPAFVASLFGTMLAGGTPAPMPPLERVQPSADYRDRLEQLLAVARPSFVVIGADAPPILPAMVRDMSRAPVIGVDALLAGGAQDVDRAVEPPASEPLAIEPLAIEDVALLQFTSGSSGQSRAVQVSFGALEANVRMIHEWLRWTDADNAISWLPVHHDMGLIGCLISAIVSQCQFWLTTPEQFVRSPVRYLRRLSDTRARLTAMPNFALDYIARRVRPDALIGTDFAACEAVIVGADPLRAESFEAFCDLLGPFGLRRSALRPAYGLAEATLAVTGLPLGEVWTALDIDPQAVSVGDSIVMAGRQSMRRSTLVGCGRPLRDVSVTIRDERGRDALPDGTVGEIVLRGCSLSQGYAHGSQIGDTSYGADGLRTGDIGFVVDGQLYVLGRSGDSLKIRGRARFAEDVESALTRAGLASNRVAALLGWSDGRPTVIILLEHPPDDWLARVETAVRPLIEDTPLHVLSVPSGTIRRTTSGKIRRRELWREFHDPRARPLAQP